MRHFMVFVLGLTFVFVALACATDKPSDVPTKTQPAEAAPMKSVKESRATFTGIVKELSDTTIKVERKIKNHVEAVEFALDKPAENFKVGDKVRVIYIKKEEKNIVRKIVPSVDKKMIKKVAPANEQKSTSLEAQPPAK